MKRGDRIRVRAKATVFGVALCVTEGLAFALSAIARIFAVDTSPVEFGIFGAVTTVLVAGWLQMDAQRAYTFADKSGFLNRDETRTRVKSVREDCPKFWLVVLHLQLHPELMDS
ncbi:hypothetical protein ACT2FY_38285 [Paraburkholderia fungorum]|uniref:hypothetical protein n=2 Tax=Paraburkholderia fungorum TaxID=134537 RepID=UPI00402B9A0B